MTNQKVYFSDIRNKIIDTIETAEYEILIAVAWFTDTKIIDSIVKCAKRNIKISIIIYDDKINKNELFKDLYYKSVDIRTSKKMMHNKFCVIDKKIVINGSYNWTFNAANNNENIQITTDNESLAFSFREEFYALQKNCLKASIEFSYIIDSVRNQESYFLNIFKSIKGKNKYPYFYKLNGYTPNKVHFKPKINNGYFLILCEDDELNFHRYKYYLEKDLNLIQISKITSKEFVKPIYFEKILELENNSHTIINLLLTTYTVEENGCENSGDVYKINNTGEILGNKRRYYKKYKNGFYEIRYRSPSPYHRESPDLLNQNLNPIKINGKLHEVIENFGIVTWNNYYYGFSDFNGKIIFENRFNSYKEINSTKIELIEFPFLIIEYNNKENKNILKKFEDSKSDVYKAHPYININYIDESKKTPTPIINNEKENTQYYFLSDSDYKFENFYKLISEYISLPVNAEYFKKLFNDFKNSYYNEKEHLKRIKNGFDWSIKETERLRQLNEKSTSKSCYIATLAYEDIEHPQVEFLRNFRDNTLRKFYLGKLLIKYYYRLAPHLVQLLKNKPTINYFLRKLLNSLIRIIQLFYN